MCQDAGLSPDIGFSGADQAMAAVEAGLSYLAEADAAALPVATLAGCLRALGRAESAHIAVRSHFLSAFNAQDGSDADGHPTAKSWLRWQTRTTSGAAGAAIAWVKRLATHPAVSAALAAGELSESWARQLCQWTDSLPPDVRADADEILLAAAAGGADLADLSGLAREIFERTAPPDPDDGPPAEDDAFRDRSLRLDLHYRGAGRLEANLTPECAAVVLALLESLGKKAGPEDDRSAGQRNHDALEEAARRLLGTGDLPDVAGQPAHMLVHATLDQLLDLSGAASMPAPAPAAPDSSAAGATWARADADGDAVADPDAAPANARSGAGGSAFAAGRAAGSGEPGWLATAVAAQAYACDAKLSTVITGHLDPEVVAAAVRAYLGYPDPPPTGQDVRPAPVELSGIRPAAPGIALPGIAAPGALPPGALPPSAGRAGESPSAEASQALLRATLLRYATAMLSGPTGLAAALRSGLPGPLGAAVSLPLDITSPTATVPPHLRRAVIVRDRHCAFAGCRRAPARCQVHHLIPRSQGGPTALHNLVLVCSYHHLILIHRRGWTLVLHADGTTTASSPDRRKILHSHAPPGTAAA